MTLALAGALIGLALVDSTSFGTLVIPLWFLLAPQRPPLRALLAYAAVVAGFYALVGLALAQVADAGLAAVRGSLESSVTAWAALVVGVGLFLLSFRYDGKRGGRGKSRVLRWRESILESDGSTRRLAALGVTAALLEVATMLPFLGAIALVVDADLPVVSRVVVIVAYCIVMMVPMLVLTAARWTFGTLLDAVMHRVDALVTKHADSAMGWILGIAGFLLARAGAATVFGWG